MPALSAAVARLRSLHRMVLPSGQRLMKNRKKDENNACTSRLRMAKCSHENEHARPDGDGSGETRKVARPLLDNEQRQARRILRDEGKPAERQRMPAGELQNTRGRAADVRRAQRLAPWVTCPNCENYWCNIHNQHAHECECPPVEDWTTDPYEPSQPIPSQHRKQRREGWTRKIQGANKSTGAGCGFGPLEQPKTRDVIRRQNMSSYPYKY